TRLIMLTRNYCEDTRDESHARSSLGLLKITRFADARGEGRMRTRAQELFGMSTSVAASHRAQRKRSQCVALLGELPFREARRVCIEERQRTRGVVRIERGLGPRYEGQLVSDRRGRRGRRRPNGRGRGAETMGRARRRGARPDLWRSLTEIDWHGG